MSKFRFLESQEFTYDELLEMWELTQELSSSLTSLHVDHRVIVPQPEEKSRLVLPSILNSKSKEFGLVSYSSLATAPFTGILVEREQLQNLKELLNKEAESNTFFPGTLRAYLEKIRRRRGKLL